MARVIHFLFKIELPDPNGINLPMSIRSSTSQSPLFTKPIRSVNDPTDCYMDEFGKYCWVDIIRVTSSKIPVTVPVSRLTHNLDHDLWGYFVYDKWVPLTPFEVLLGNDMIHWEKIRQADLSCPIVITDESLIVDGVYKLCRAFNDGIKTINTIYISRQELDSIRF